jgi:hypothetical protein
MDRNLTEAAVASLAAISVLGIRMSMFYTPEALPDRTKSFVVASSSSSVRCQARSRSYSTSKNPSQRGESLSDSELWVDMAASHSAASGKNSSMFLYPLWP